MLAEALSTVLVACLSAFHMHSQNERQKSVTPGLIHTELLLEVGVILGLGNDLDVVQLLCAYGGCC